jgi:hypothetical protein
LNTVTGTLYRQLSGWEVSSELYERLGELKRFEGEFAERPQLADAIWMLCNTAGWILHVNGQFETLEERDRIQAKLKERYATLLVAESHRFLEDEHTP